MRLHLQILLLSTFVSQAYVGVQAGELPSPIAPESTILDANDIFNTTATSEVPVIEQVSNNLVECVPATGGDASRAADSCGIGDGCGMAPIKDDCGCFLFSDDPLLKGLKNQKAGKFTYSVGGEIRHRYIDEENRLRPNIPAQGTHTNYNQYRFTPFMEVGYDDFIKGYVQGIDASTFGEELPIVAIDENRWDLNQYYADVNLFKTKEESLTFRYGRQFLNYGDQHIISPLAWANTYRNFEGAKLMYKTSDFQVDAFAVNPVNGASRNAVFNVNQFDTPDQSNWLTGVYSSYTGIKNKTIDTFWLYSDEDEPSGIKADGQRHMVGGRYAGTAANGGTKDKPEYKINWDLSGGYQFGQDALFSPDQDVSSYFASAIGGVTLAKVGWTPKIEGVFWYGSGDGDPTDGQQNTYFSYYPLGHAFWGQIDNFSGQNLLNYGAQITLNPTKKLKLYSGYLLFQKAEEADRIYNIAGAALGPAGTSSSIGRELDLIATYSVNANLSCEAGYFYFWYDDAVTRTALNRDDAQQVYLMTTYKF